MSFLRHGAVLLATGLFTWWLLFFAPAPDLALAEPTESRPPLRTQLQPSAEPDALASAPAPTVEPSEEPAVEPVEEPVEETVEEPTPAEPEPSPSEPVQEVAEAELGSRDGSEEAERREALQEDEQEAERPERRPMEDLARNPDLLRQATAELGGAEVALGFATTLISLPEQQLEIARAFGEEIVLVPKAALAADSSADSFRLRPARSSQLETLRGLPDLQGSRQHRDLFAYELGRLPKEIRALRRSVIRRDEVFLFAALIPTSEWAIVIGRRQEAVQAAGIEESEVERYVLRYVRAQAGGFDFLVEEIHLAGGQRLHHPFTSQR